MGCRNILDIILIFILTWFVGSPDETVEQLSNESIEVADVIFDEFSVCPFVKISLSLFPFVCTDIPPLPLIIQLLLLLFVGDGIDEDVDDGVSILARFSGGCKILNGFLSDNDKDGESDDDEEVDWEYNSWWCEFPTVLLLAAVTPPPPTTPPPPYKADSNWIDARINEVFKR